MRYSAHTFIKVTAALLLLTWVVIQTHSQTSKVPIVVPNMIRGSDIYLYDTLTGSIDLLVTDSSRNGQPSLSPDNSQLVFSSNRSGMIDLYLMDLNTQYIVQITNDSLFETSPAWDWASERIVYEAESQLFIYYVASGVIENIATGYNFLEPEWSPDGQSIVFTSYDTPNRVFRSYILELSSEIITLITPAEMTISSPKWSPDGTMIAFWSADQIYIWEAASGQITQITSEQYDLTMFAWQQDNTLLYQMGGPSGPIYQIQPNGTGKQLAPLTLPYFPYLSGVELPDLLILPTPTPTPVPLNADAGMDYTVRIPIDGIAEPGLTTDITLNGSASTGSITAYEWRNSSNNVVSTQQTDTQTVGLGTHTYTLKVSSSEGFDTDTVTITVETCIYAPPGCGGGASRP